MICIMHAGKCPGTGFHPEYEGIVIRQNDELINYTHVFCLVKFVVSAVSVFFCFGVYAS